MMDFDTVLESIGPFGWFQIYLYILIGIGVMPVGMHNVANVFVAALPEYSCATTSLSPSKNNEFLASVKPKIGDMRCEVYDMNYTEVLLSSGFNSTGHILINNNTETTQCKKWNFDDAVYGRTIVSEWDLVCKDSFLRPLSSSVYMLGFLVGAIGFGTISDRWGRKFAWTVSSALLAVSGIAAAFVPNYWAHIFMRLICGCGAAGSFTTGFVLCMEVIGEDLPRMVYGNLYQVWFALGYMVMTGLAYLIRDYQYLLLTISLLPGIFCINQCLLFESPRWLLAHQKIDKCEAVLKKAARFNKTSYSHSMLVDVADKMTVQETKSDKTTTYTLLDLLRTPNMRKKSLNIFYSWFVINFVYYGLTFGASDFVGSPYLNLFISGLVEIPSYFVVSAALNYLGRPRSLGIMTAGGGLCCLCTILIPDGMEIVRTVLTMLGRFGISGSFGIIYVYSGELFPTVVRTTGVGAGSMHGRVGGLIAPFVADLGITAWRHLPFIIFGLSAILGGVLALFLPETLNQPLPETLEDGENFGKDSCHCCAKRLKVPHDKQLEVDAEKQEADVV